MGLSHTHVWSFKIRRDILAVEVLPEEQGVPASYQNPQPRVSVSERQVPITSGFENQQGLWLAEMEGSLSPR